jgi:hypothetical protein
MIPRRTPTLRASGSFSIGALFALVLGLLPLGAAHAQTLTWTGAANGTTFNLAGNWSPAAAPGPTHDCVIPAGAGTINLGGTSVRSITTARNLFVEACTTVNLTGGLTLQSGAIVQIDNTGGCTGLIFKSGTQSIAGSGSIFISSAGNGGRAISVQDACTLTIEAGVPIAYGPSTWGTSAQVFVEAGSSIESASTISVQQAGLTLSIAGPGSFTNSGTLRADAGTLNLQAGAWSNSGAVQIASGAVAGFGGSFASLGSVVNSGGTVKVTGAANSSTITATASTGPITLAGATLVACTLQSADGTGFVTDGTCTLNGCTVGANLTLGSCSKILVTNSLTLANNALVMIGDTCTGPPLEFRSGNQFIHGSGTIQLRKDDSNDDGALRLTTQVTLTIDAGITVASTIGTGTQSLEVDGGCTLINNGTIVTQSGTFKLDASVSHLTNNGTISASGGNFTLDSSGPNAQFTNAGTLAFGNASVAEIEGGEWSNTGGITLDSARLSVSDNWTNSGTIVGVASTFTSSGTAWLNSGGATFTNCTTKILSATWINSATIDAIGGTLEFQGAWSNAGSVGIANAAVTFAGTYSSLGTLSRSGGTITIGGTYSGAILAATAQTGDLVVAATLNGVTLVNQGAMLFPSSPVLTDCTIASDLFVGTSRRITVKGILTLANNAVITFGTAASGGNAGGLFLSGGSPVISGAGTIRILQSTTLFTFNSPTNLTLGPLVKFTLGPGAFANTEARTTIPAGSSITNQGTFGVAQSGCTLLFIGPGFFKNEGVLDLAGGTLDLRAFSGPVGTVQFGPNASLALQGNYTIDQPLNCTGNLTLGGTWTNNSTVSVTGGVLSLGGTWTNNGTFALDSSVWSIGGNYTTVGTFTVVNTPRTILGTYPDALLVADAVTGDVSFSSAIFTNARLEARDGAVFRISSGGAWAILDGCTLAGDLLAGGCAVIQVENGLTLEGGASISLESTATCGPAILSSPFGNQTIGGNGEIALRNTNATTGSIQVLNTATLTIGSGVSVVCPADGRGGAKIFLSVGATLNNLGTLAMRLPTKTLWLSSDGGTFFNGGTLESTAGLLLVDTATIQNFNATTFTLSGGKWLARGGGLSLGNRSIRIIAPDTEVGVMSPSGNSAPNLSALTLNQGILRVGARTAGVTPVGGTFTNSGLIDLKPDGIFYVTGILALQPTGTVRTEISGIGTAKFGRLQATSSVSVTGHLRGVFASTYAPAAGASYTPFIAGSQVTGAFSDVCFDDNPQNMGVVQNLLASQMRLLASAASGTAPAITQQPQSTSANPDAIFNVAAAPTGVTYQWQKGGVALSDGPTPHDSSISGSQTKTLTIHNARPEDAGSYEAVATNSCGSATSDPATLSVCTGDLNADGLVDDADFVLFLAGYNILDCADPAMPAACPADLNSDGVVDDTDFQIFVPAYDALVCP